MTDREKKQFLTDFMEHYRDNDGMGKRDSEAIDCFLKSEEPNENQIIGQSTII